MATDPMTLLQRLNPFCAKALESAASLCQTRAHAEITLEHWLLKLLEQGNGDISVIIRHYQLDMDEIWQGLLSHLDSLPHAMQQKPTLSQPLLEILKSAWLTASLEQQSDSIRSVDLLQALQNLPQCLKAKDAWPLLSFAVISLQRFRPKLDELSEENPQIQLIQYQNNMPELAQKTQETKPDTGKESAQEANTTVNKNAAATIQKHHQAALERFTVDVTANAKADKIDPVFGRDSEIRQMVDILSRRRKNNPILVGEPGVGKTALVEGLALRIAEGNVPSSLKNVSVLTLDLGLLQAGAGVKGEFEQRLKNVIEAVQQSPTPILLFIDEAHTIIGAGNSAGGADAANLLKPALARGELRTIAATTWSEYKQYFERDAALERRFQMVKVDEPDDLNASLMLRGLKSRYAKHHGVHILDEAVTAAVTLSRRYITGRQLPDKAVDLLDTASARVRMSLDTVPEPITQLEAQLQALTLEQEALLNDQHIATAIDTKTLDERLETIKTQQQQLTTELKLLQTQFEQEQKLIKQLLELRTQAPKKVTKKSNERLKNSIKDSGKAVAPNLIELQQQLITAQKGNPLLSLDVNSRVVATVIADWTGVPLESLLKDEQTHLLQLEHDLQKRVVGQDHALSDIAQRIRSAKTGLTSEDAPMGVFLLVGPSGVGKTETALALGDLLFGGQQALVTINMSEYQESHTVSQLKGSPPGYVGYGQGGVLTEAVRKRPYSVVLLDEVEKAHRDILNLFYQVFDRGFMRDGEGREIDFRNTLILMTSNLGSDQLMALFDEYAENGQIDVPMAAQQELLRPIIRDHFQPALLARFQTVIFRPLAASALRQIVEMKLDKVAARLHKHYAIEFLVNESLYDYLTHACLLPDTGARNIDSILNQQLLPALSNILLQQQANHKKLQTLSLGFDEQNGISLDWQEKSTQPTKPVNSAVKGIVKSTAKKSINSNNKVKKDKTKSTNKVSKNKPKA